MAEPVVTTSQRLWSEEVAIANAKDPLPVMDERYVFSNGRTFYTLPDPYDKPA